MAVQAKQTLGLTPEEFDSSLRLACGMKHPLKMSLSFHPLAEKSIGVFIQIKLGASEFKIPSVFFLGDTHEGRLRAMADSESSDDFQRQAI